jgi:transposase-like protein
MPRLSNDERNRAVTMLLQGVTQQEVATALVVPQTTVHGSMKNVQFKNRVNGA